MGRGGWRMSGADGEVLALVSPSYLLELCPPPPGFLAFPRTPLSPSPSDRAPPVSPVTADNVAAGPPARFQATGT